MISSPHHPEGPKSRTNNKMQHLGSRPYNIQGTTLTMQTSPVSPKTTIEAIGLLDQQRQNK